MRCLSVFFALCCALTASAATAQLMQPSISPIVHADGSITFALDAPAADSVSVLSYPGQPMAAARDDDGRWSLTTGPLEPGVHFYSFVVDGVTIPDPANRLLHSSLFPTISIVIVPGDPPRVTEERDVPRGTVHQHRHRSVLLGDLRGYAVYTPPGYTDGDTRRYPVLYLLHGYTGHEQDWTQSGRAGVILDNLIADGEAVPMILVMPYGYVPPRDGDGDGSWPEWFAAVTPRLEPYLVDELRTLVEKEYRTLDHPGSRGIAGVSMGGGQALVFGLRHLELFGWIGGFSPAVHRELMWPLIEDARRLNDGLSLLWLGCGRDDFLFEYNQAFLAALDSAGVEHVAHITEGEHLWPVWHGYFRAFAARLFQR